MPSSSCGSTSPRRREAVRGVCPIVIPVQYIVGELAWAVGRSTTPHASARALPRDALICTNARSRDRSGRGRHGGAGYSGDKSGARLIKVVHCSLCSSQPSELRSRRYAHGAGWRVEVDNRQSTGRLRKRARLVNLSLRCQVSHYALFSPCRSDRVQVALNGLLRSRSVHYSTLSCVMYARKANGWLVSGHTERRPCQHPD